jgi:hypothetical protein
MINQTVDPHHYVRRARQIKAKIPIVMSQWGLLPKFTRWRLAQDPETGLVVLFGVLDSKHIATHTTTPFSDYFDPRLLRDLETELQVQMISSSNDGLRYAFILEKGELDLPPVPVQTPEYDPSNQLLPGGVQNTFVERRIALPGGVQWKFIERRVAPPQPNHSTLSEEPSLLHQSLERFLKITEALDAPDDATTQPSPDVLMMDDAEFNQHMTDYEANRNNHEMP